MGSIKNEKLRIKKDKRTITNNQLRMTENNYELRGVKLLAMGINYGIAGYL